MTAGGGSNAHTCTILSSISLVVAGTRCPPPTVRTGHREGGPRRFARVCKFAVDHKSLPCDSKVIPVIGDNPGPPYGAEEIHSARGAVSNRYN